MKRSLLLLLCLAPLWAPLFSRPLIFALGETEKNLSPEQRDSYRALERAEKFSESYPKLRVFVELMQPEKLRQEPTRPLQVAPSLYEMFLWLENFSLVSSLSPASLQNLGQSLAQLLYSSGKSETAELGRIFIKDYFRKVAYSPYPGQGSWLVFRIFLEPLPEAVRLRFVSNAYWENSPAPSVIQRRGFYPQGEEGSTQYAYLLPDAAGYRLSFAPDPYAQNTLHPQYSTAKSLEILRFYLRDANAANDNLVAPAIRNLTRQGLDADSYFQSQEIMLYYYLLYSPQHSGYLIQSRQNLPELANATDPIQGLWRIHIPKIWAAIEALQLRSSPELERLLPG